MKKIIVSGIFFLAIVAISCDDETKTITIDPTQPNGDFNADMTGSIVEQNGTGSTGTVELGTDEDGTQFLHFASNFSTNLGTGTVSIYFSTSMDYVADPPNGNPDLRLLGPVTKNGESYVKVDPSLDAKFTHVILWCGSASIPFGYAELN